MISWCGGSSLHTKHRMCNVHYRNILCEGGIALLVRIMNSCTGFSFTFVSVILYFGCPFSITGLPFLSRTCVFVLTVFSTVTVRSLRIPVKPLSFGCAIYLKFINIQRKERESVWKDKTNPMRKEWLSPENYLDLWALLILQAL